MSIPLDGQLFSGSWHGSELAESPPLPRDTPLSSPAANKAKSAFARYMDSERPGWDEKRAPLQGRCKKALDSRAENFKTALSARTAWAALRERTKKVAHGILSHIQSAKTRATAGIKELQGMSRAELKQKTAEQTVKTARGLLTKGYTLGHRLAERVRSAGKQQNFLQAIRTLHSSGKAAQALTMMGSWLPSSAAAGLASASQIAAVAVAPVCHVLAATIVYSNVKKLWKMDSPVALIREKASLAARVASVHAKGKLKVTLEKYADHKKRITQMSVVSMEYQRLRNKMKSAEGLTLEEETRYCMLRVLDRKLFYRKLHAHIFIAHAAFITAATSFGIAGLAAGGPTGPILMGIGMGVGAAGFFGSMGLRLAIFMIRRMRRHFVNDSPDGAQRYYIKSDDMRHFLRAQLKEEASQQVRYPHLERLREVEPTPEEIQNWTNNELALFLLMRGRRKKTRFKATKGGKLHPHYINITPESFRNALFVEGGNHHKFNGAWKKAFGGR